MKRQGRTILVSATAVEFAWIYPSVASPALLAPARAPRLASAELNLLLGKSTKVLNTSHSCWLTLSGVESIQIVLPLLSIRLQKFILHQTRLVTY